MCLAQQAVASLLARPEHTFVLCKVDRLRSVQALQAAAKPQSASAMYNSLIALLCTKVSSAGRWQAGEGICLDYDTAAMHSMAAMYVQTGHSSAARKMEMSLADMHSDLLQCSRIVLQSVPTSCAVFACNAAEQRRVEL